MTLEEQIEELEAQILCCKRVLPYYPIGTMRRYRCEQQLATLQDQLQQLLPAPQPLPAEVTQLVDDILKDER